MKVLLIGTWESNAGILARQLSYYGIDADVIYFGRFPNPFYIDRYDVIYGTYLYDGQYAILVAKLLGKKTIVHIVGTDAFKFAKRRKFFRSIKEKVALQLCDKIIYCSPELKRSVGLDGEVLPIPIDTKIFKPPVKIISDEEKRDVLYYCPDHRPTTYKLNWILSYAKKNPNQTITILGLKQSLPMKNIQIVPYVPYEEMPTIYYRHKKLIRMTTHDGAPKMPYEALLCGLEVIWNGRELTRVPTSMLMEKTIPKLITLIKNIV